MVDRLTATKRSWNMSRIKCRNTLPELAVQRLLRKWRISFQKHGKTIPGNPDLLLKKSRTAVFVHGCFWHRHKNCRFAYSPKSRMEFWTAKFTKNVERDRKVKRLVKRAGWNYVQIWECETSDPEKFRRRLARGVVLKRPATAKRARRAS